MLPIKINNSFKLYTEQKKTNVKKKGKYMLFWRYFEGLHYRVICDEGDSVRSLKYLNVIN